MLKVEQLEFIRTSYRVYGLSISEIVRKTGHSRNTIRKVLRNEHSGYATRKQQPMPALEGFAEIIDSWLEQDKQRPPKQRYTARRIFRRLVHEHGFQGSEPAVRRYVRQAKTRIGLGAKGAFIPAEPDAGQEAEMDCGGTLKPTSPGN